MGIKKKINKTNTFITSCTIAKVNFEDEKIFLNYDETNANEQVNIKGRCKNDYNELSSLLYKAVQTNFKSN